MWLICLYVFLGSGESIIDYFVVSDLIVNSAESPFVRPSEPPPVEYDVSVGPHHIVNMALKGGARMTSYRKFFKPKSFPVRLEKGSLRNFFAKGGANVGYDDGVAAGGGACFTLGCVFLILVRSCLARRAERRTTWTRLSW